MKKILGILGIFAFVAALLFGIRTYNLKKYHMEKQTRFIMDTFVTVQAAGPREKARKAVSGALDRFEQINTKMDCLKAGSPLYVFNHDDKGEIDDPEIVRLVEKGLEVSRASNGAFDMTLLPLSELWGFPTKSPRRPPDAEVRKALARTGYRYLEVRDGKLRKLKAGITLDLGGIAKGYAVGEALKVLKAEGITSAIINAGGNVFAVGLRPDGKKWKVGVKDPRGDGVLGYVEMQDMSISSSGDYERFFEENGKRYHHIFDSRTGYPADGGLASASIVYDDCTLTDAWTKVLFVMGPEKAMELLRKLPGMRAVWVTHSGEVKSSEETGTLKRMDPGR